MEYEATEHYNETTNWHSTALPRDIFEAMDNKTSSTYEKASNKVEATWYETAGAELKVLHRYAAIGSAVKIINPLNDVVVYAKVSGKISKEAEKKGLVMEISSKAMKLLKIYDDEFFVDCVYFVEDIAGK